jgi:hypothetical protein
VLHEIGEVLPGKLLRRKLLHERRALLPRRLLPVNRKRVAGSW